jgi:hypothetical protein
VAGFCEHSNEPLGSIKGGEFIYQLSDCQLLKVNSASWISLLSSTLVTTYEKGKR